MMSLPYMQLYIADYLADTTHLTAAQHGAYMLILMNYWQRGKPPKDSDERMAQIARMSLDEWLRNRDVIEEFFVVEDGLWKHHRVEKDLSAVSAKIAKASLAGQASAAKRWGAKSLPQQGKVTTVTPGLRPEFNSEVTNKIRIDIEEKEKEKNLIKKEKEKAKVFLVAGDLKELSPDVAEQYCAFRKSKGASLTPRAWGVILKEIELAGMSPDDGVCMAMARGWQGFKHEWVENDARRRDVGKKISGKCAAGDEYIAKLHADAARDIASHGRVATASRDVPIDVEAIRIA